MKSLCGLFWVLALVGCLSGNEHVRRKRFFKSLWPSEDVNNGLIYSQLPPDYLFLLPGVNDHKMIQRRAGAQPQQASPQPQPSRFVHPTRMVLLMQPNQQQKLNQPQVNSKPQSNNLQQPQQLVKRIVMKPVPKQVPNLSPSISLKTMEQSLPDIHKHNQFVQPKPFIRAPQIQPFNTQQQLPIKRAFDSAPVLVSTAPVLSVKTASIKDFYFTREFQDLLQEFKIKVELHKLPAISDVMAILGTTNAEETLKSIREVAQSREGMDLIQGYLDRSSDEDDDDQFYNYDDDVGAGEIQVDGTDVKFAQTHQNNPISEQTLLTQHQTFGDVQKTPEEFNQNFATPHQSFGLSNNLDRPMFTAVPPAQLTNEPIRATTSGTLTGTGNSWWKPTTWFSSSSPTKVESIKTDGEILKNVVSVPTSGSVWDNINYIGNFLKPVTKESVPILQRPQISRNFNLNNPSQPQPPTVQMTEAQFQDMVKVLKLIPMNHQIMQESPIHQQQKIQVVSNVQKNPQHASASNQAPKLSSPAEEIKLSDKNLRNEFIASSPDVVFTQSPQTRFQAPINVQPVSSGIPLPSTFSQYDNRRNFISASEPQRAAPYDFIATGRIHKANPHEVSKRSRSLVEAIEGNYN